MENKKEKLEEMRKFEIFSNIEIPPKCWYIARLDGKGFSKLTQEMKLKKPFDLNFKISMINAIKEVILKSGAILGYFESDEVSILFNKDCYFFKRRIEKINSVLSSMLTAECMKQDFFKGFLPVFDCRLLSLPTEKEVFNIFKWRLNDSLRNCLSGFVFWELVFSGKSKKEATKILNNMKAKEKQELLFKQFKINFNNIEKWKKNGTFIYFSDIKKKGFNPKTKKEVFVNRRILKEKCKEFKNKNNFFKELNLI